MDRAAFTIIFTASVGVRTLSLEFENWDDLDQALTDIERGGIGKVTISTTSGPVLIPCNFVATVVSHKPGEAIVVDY